ncbi:concanavalin A-like lectin/glucanase domain-containing protein [Gamsiella multidivaricata]|uniref:concanavalin A-like lectin/glucanase domain-containing protein n=1 Tax=Gamsiella multidivaricata TaxID=101098 RepID=UPI00222018B6|nr:concanavalin A-like lectin/glucanase domain-containing protein [Gamsiella multidivaricata]KAI7818709.1 concanavalin A-like lectin/glucanase domain-containing protein [Gamsiella multidivaricata]
MNPSLSNITSTSAIPVPNAHNDHNSTISTACTEYFDPLTSSPTPRYIVPHGVTPQNRNCTYMKENILPSAQGTAIVIGKGSPESPFSCGELIWRERATYGIYSVDMISSNIRGHVTGFFLIANGISEIDVELTGLDAKVGYLNIWKGSKQNPVKVPLGFDASEGWHRYAIEWREDLVAWYIDGQMVLKRSDIETADPEKTTYKLVLNSWTHNVEDRWAGKFVWPSNVDIVQSQFRNLMYTP